MELSASQRKLLLAVASGHFLKAHRDIEGNKSFKLYPLEGEAQLIDRDDVHALVDGGLIDSNKKFPAATFWLTGRGKRLADTLTPRTPEPPEQEQ